MKQPKNPLPRQYKPRIKPVTNIPDYIGGGIILIIVGVLFLTVEDVRDTIKFLIGGSEILDQILAYLAVALGIGIVIWGIKEELHPSSSWSKFKRSSLDTNAKVIRRKEIENEYKDDEGQTRYSYKLLVTLEYIPRGLQGKWSKRVRTADVSGPIFYGLEEGQQIKIRYAQEDPDIFLVEGEF